MAVLSGKVPNYIPPDLRDEEGWCRLLEFRLSHHCTEGLDRAPCPIA